MIIRTETQAEATAISALITRAFANMMHSNHAEARIVEELRASGALTISLVADQSQTILGHVAFSPITWSDHSTNWFGLGPVAVEPQAQKQGIGAKLILQGLAQLRERGAKGCVVMGEPDYYQRFGFRARTDMVYPGVPPQYFMALAFQDQWPQGEARYHDAFIGIERVEG